MFHQYSMDQFQLHFTVPDTLKKLLSEIWWSCHLKNHPIVFTVCKDMLPPNSSCRDCFKLRNFCSVQILCSYFKCKAPICGSRSECLIAFWNIFKFRSATRFLKRIIPTRFGIWLIDMCKMAVHDSVLLSEVVFAYEP